MHTKSLLSCIALSFALANAAPQFYYNPIPSPAPAPPPPPSPAPAPVYGPYPPLHHHLLLPHHQPTWSFQDAPPANYVYAYSVLDAESGVDISADEQADNGAISGSYKVALPDGRIKTVTYTVEGDSGFVADVQYEAAPASLGPAPAPAPAPYPTYVPYSF
nr:cuticle protein 7-like [Lepeophtheirus salmonis]